VKVYAGDGTLKQNFPSGRIKHSFDVSHGVRSQADYMTLLSTFYVVLGTPYDGLLFKDWADFRATSVDSALVFITGTTWQLQRKYTFGAITYLRKITRPLTGVQIYSAADALLTSSVVTTTGVATVTGTPAYWVGEFNVPVTFSANEWTASLEVHTDNLHLMNESVMLEEVLE